jgi:hypothetical protein
MMVIKLLDKEIEPEVVRDGTNLVEISFSIGHDPSLIMQWIEATLHPKEVAQFMHLWSNDQATREFSIAEDCLYIRSID